MRALLTIAVTAVLVAAGNGVAYAERWVRLAPWIYLDADSIRREGNFTYYVVMHSAAADLDPRASGAMANRTPTPSRVDCSTGEMAANFGEGWEVDDELTSADPLARYVCPQWFS